MGQYERGIDLSQLRSNSSMVARMHPRPGVGGLFQNFHALIQLASNQLT